jgi:hypothetical protein
VKTQGGRSPDAIEAGTPRTIAQLKSVAGDRTRQPKKPGADTQGVLQEPAGTVPKPEVPDPPVAEKEPPPGPSQKDPPGAVPDKDANPAPEKPPAPELPPPVAPPKKESVPLAPTDPTRFALPLEALGRVEKVRAAKITRIEGRTTFNTTVVYLCCSREKCRFEETSSSDMLKAIFNGPECWICTGGSSPVRTLTGAELESKRNFFFAHGTGHLVSLMDQGYRFVVVQKTRVRGRPSTKVKASSAGQPTFFMFFDDQSRLLAKTEYEHPKMGRIEVFFSNYKEVRGIKHWHHLEKLLNGKRAGELDVRSVRFYEKEEPWMFANPKGAN